MTIKIKSVEDEIDHNAANETYAEKHLAASRKRKAEKILMENYDSRRHASIVISHEKDNPYFLFHLMREMSHDVIVRGLKMWAENIPEDGKNMWGQIEYSQEILTLRAKILEEKHEAKTTATINAEFIGAGDGGETPNNGETHG